MRRGSPVLLLLCFLTVNVVNAADQHENQETIIAKPLPVVAIHLPTVKASTELLKYRKNLEKEKDRFLVAIDLPIHLVKIQMIDVEQIKNATMPKDLKQLNKEVAIKYPLTPSFGLYSRNFYLDLDGGFLEISDGNREYRNFKYVDGTIQGSIWMVLVGAEGFFFQEAVPNILGTSDFKINFGRQSYGGNGFGGVKIGKFNRSFVSGGFGRGYLVAEGYEIYESKIISHLNPFSLYHEEMKTWYIFSEARGVLGHVAPRARVERVLYERVPLRSDLSLYGLKNNKFKDTELEADIELIPSLKHDWVRFVFRTRKHFEDNEKFLIRNSYPEWQVFLRIAF